MRSAHVRAREPGRVDANNKYLPSAENLGCELSVLGDVYRVASPPAAGTTQISLCRLFSLSRTVVTVNAISLPSGETAGADSVVTLYQSAGVNARRFATVCVCAACAPRDGSARGAKSAAIAKDSDRMDVCFTVAPRS